MKRQKLKSAMAFIVTILFALSMLCIVYWKAGKLLNLK